MLAAIAVPTVAAPRVVASIAPLHSLVAGVMAGVGEPVLLFPAASSPHGAGIKPSQVRAVVQADLVLRIDPHFEPAIERVIDQNFDEEAVARVVTLSETPGIALLSARSVDLMDLVREHGDGDSDAHKHAHDHDHHDTGELDPHLWLSTTNASVIADVVAENLARIDPDNADRYRVNADRVQARFVATRMAVNEKLKGVGHEWLLFHDAYQYFEKEFDLTPASIATPDPERAVSGKRLLQLVEMVEDNRVKCIFVEPQLRSDVVTMLAGSAEVTVLSLDPLGSGIVPGEELWFEVMLNMADQMRACG